MEGAPKLHRELVQRPVGERKPSFRVAAGMAVLGAVTATALILSPLNFAMGQDTDAKKKELKKTEEKAPALILASRLDTSLDKKGVIPTATKAIAEDKDKKPVQLAQVRKVNYDAGNYIDLNALPRVSLDELSKFDAETHEFMLKYGGFVVNQTRSVDGYDCFTYVVKIPVPNQKWGIVASAIIGYSGGKEYHNDLGIQILQNGKEVGTIVELSELANAYYQVGKKELKYVKVIGEIGYDREVGDYISIIVVPTEKPNGEIRPGIPCLVTSYYNGTTHEPGMLLIQ